MKFKIINIFLLLLIISLIGFVAYNTYSVIGNTKTVDILYKVNNNTQLLMSGYTNCIDEVTIQVIQGRMGINTYLADDDIQSKTKELKAGNFMVTMQGLKIGMAEHRQGRPFFRITQVYDYAIKDYFEKIAVSKIVPDINIDGIESVLKEIN